MHIPKAFQVNDQETIRTFLKTHPFGTIVVSKSEDFPVVGHFPFLLKEVDEKWSVEFHLARENELCSVLEKEGKTTLIVSGAKGYVSSSVYTHVNVPTYNYQAVHLSGTVIKMHDRQLLQHLREVVADFEKNREQPIDFDAWPAEMIESAMKGIVGFHLTVTKTEAAFKLSQNRNAIDFQRIVDDLKNGNSGQRALAKAMLETKR